MNQGTPTGQDVERAELRAEVRALRKWKAEALTVWNSLRNRLGLPELSRRDFRSWDRGRYAYSDSSVLWAESQTLAAWRKEGV